MEALPMKHEIITHQASFSTAGQSEHFQINLPRDAQQIIGVETGAICLDSAISLEDPYGGLPIVDFRQDMDMLFFVMPKKLIGRLTLWAAGQTGIIYQSDVWQWDNSFNYGDVLPFTSWISPQFVQSTHMRKANICVKGEQFIEGYFKSSWNNYIPSNVKFLFNVYLWIERS